MADRVWRWWYRIAFGGSSKAHLQGCRGRAFGLRDRELGGAACLALLRLDSVRSGPCIEGMVFWHHGPQSPIRSEARQGAEG